ncbi:MAG: RsmD family RNA methyltransferase [Pirellulales bacterium]|nr:RsmD family RNA methyltransferase [Pirellulales bacterium]
MARRRPASPLPAARAEPTELRIVGGALRGRKLRYGGERRVRPMKDRVREAVFNLLGPSVRGKQAIDLFGGTGALGLEAISRGASRALFIEQHLPTAMILRENVATLGVESVCEVIRGDTFVWGERGPAPPPAPPWLVFASPPYDFYVSRADDMLRLVGRLVERAPAGSLFAVESDERFDIGLLPLAERWDVRRYPPAVVGILRIKPPDNEPEPL